MDYKVCTSITPSLQSADRNEWGSRGKVAVALAEGSGCSRGGFCAGSLGGKAVTRVTLQQSFSPGRIPPCLSFPQW